jgi:hypothetical protein
LRASIASVERVRLANIGPILYAFNAKEAEASVAITESMSGEKNVQAVRRDWEPPALFDLPLFAAESASIEDEHVAPMPEPPHPPPAAGGKLGFSIEMAFPLAVRSNT